MLWERVETVSQILFLAGAAYCLLLSLSNIIWLKKSFRRPYSTYGPKISVLIPCRNEETNIRRCLDSLITQSYSNYEIIVLDDQSSDGTWEILTEYAEQHPQLIRAIAGKPPPLDHWNGKPYAMQQLAEHADGEYLLFTDADTVHGYHSLSWAATNLDFYQADCVSGYVFQELKTFGEMLIVPATYIMSTMIMPLWLIGRARAPGLSFAIGQLITFRRHAFEAVGGYSSISRCISDDVSMARHMKMSGFRVVFLDIRRIVSCRMYCGYRAAMNGLGKNIYDFFRHRPIFLASAATALVVIALLPLLILLFQLCNAGPYTKSTLLSVAMFFSAWSMVLYDRGMRWWVPFLYPLLFINLLWMVWRSFGLISSGRGVIWKGRVLR